MLIDLTENLLRFLIFFSTSNDNMTEKLLSIKIKSNARKKILVPIVSITFWIFD